MAKVIVIGASRGIGLETVKTALAGGHSVRALARSAASIPVQNAGLEKVPGNALDSNTIWHALEGVDVVVQTLGVDIAPRSIFERTTLFSQSTRIVVDAMKICRREATDCGNRPRCRRQPRSWWSSL
jgi:putative NADH-flavin reductase